MKAAACAASLFGGGSGAAVAIWFFRRNAEAAKALGFMLFASGEETEQVVVGLGAESFCTVAVVMQKARRKGTRRVLAVFVFKMIERGQGNAVSAVEMAKRLKEVGFQLMFGLTLRGWIGAYSFMNSHGCLSQGDYG